MVREQERLLDRGRDILLPDDQATELCARDREREPETAIVSTGTDVCDPA